MFLTMSPTGKQPRQRAVQSAPQFSLPGSLTAPLFSMPAPVVC